MGTMGSRARFGRFERAPLQPRWVLMAGRPVNLTYLILIAQGALDQAGARCGHPEHPPPLPCLVHVHSLEAELFAIYSRRRIVVVNNPKLLACTEKGGLSCIASEIELWKSRTS